jgi:hypothetical protein
VSWVQNAKLQFTINGEWEAYPERPNVYLTNFPAIAWCWSGANRHAWKRRWACTTWPPSC